MVEVASRPADRLTYVHVTQEAITSLDLRVSPERGQLPSLRTFSWIILVV